MGMRLIDCKKKKLEQLEVFLEKIEDYRLLELAEARKDSPTIDFKEYLMEEGLDEEDLL